MEETPIVHQEDCDGFENEDAKGQSICKSICMTHMECEPFRDDDFKFCPECWHVFRTPKELVDAHMEVLKKIDSHQFIRPAATDINVCPVCTHDF